MLIWAIIPTLLYYLGIVLAVEVDARRFGARAVDVDAPSRVAAAAPRRLPLRSRSAIIVVFLALDIPPFTAVVYATGVAALFALVHGWSAGDERGWLRAGRLATRCSTGVRGALPVIAVCAAAGVITSTITKTGLGSGARVERWSTLAQAICVRTRPWC